MKVRKVNKMFVLRRMRGRKAFNENLTKAIDWANNNAPMATWLPPKTDYHHRNPLFKLMEERAKDQNDRNTA